MAFILYVLRVYQYASMDSLPTFSAEDSESIVKNLVKQGLLKSSSGKGGGYLLTRDPEMYNILEILEATELTMAPAACLEKGAKECTRRPNCKTLHMWTNYYELTKRYFSGITIKDLIQEKPLDFVI
ncbi:MAG: RrF2 family transcriptional regulator [Succinivibrionaceae bacterium]